MRLLLSCILFVGLGLAVTSASPISKKLEKKSISESAAAGAGEVDQRLDAPQLGEQALMESSPGAKVERAKKQASTTFCVEIRHNKPTQVDCDELHRPHPQPPPAPYIPEPLPEIHVHPPPAPAPIVIPQPPPPPPPPPPINIQVPVPCEPEIAAYVIQPPSEVVYAPTGNCAPQVPSVLHGGGGNAGVQVFQIPGGLHSTPTHGAGVHGTPGGLSVHGQATLPLHNHGGGLSVHTHDSGPVHPQANLPHIQTQVQPMPVHQTQVQVPMPIQTQVQVPMPIQTQVQVPQAPMHVHTHTGPVQPQAPVQVHTHAQMPVQSHLLHQLTPGLECSCQSAQAGLIFQRAQGAPGMNNEALALQFLQDIQRNNNAQIPLAGTAIIMQPASVNTMPANPQERQQMTPSRSNSGPSMSLSMPSVPMPAVSAGSSVQMGNGKSMFPAIQARAQVQTPTLPPPPIGQQQQQQQPARSFQMKPLMSAGNSRTNNPDNFDDGTPTPRPQLLRLSRGPGEIDSKDPNKSIIRPKENDRKGSPSDIMSQIMKKSGGAVEAKVPNDKSDAKRIARYLLNEKDSESNLIDD